MASEHIFLYTTKYNAMIIGKNFLDSLQRMGIYRCEESGIKVHHLYLIDMFVIKKCRRARKRHDKAIGS